MVEAGFQFQVCKIFVDLLFFEQQLSTDSVYFVFRKLRSDAAHERSRPGHTHTASKKNIIQQEDTNLPPPEIICRASAGSEARSKKTTRKNFPIPKRFMA